MNDHVTRPELESKLELIEARADARLARFEERIDQAIGEMRRDSAALASEFRQLRSDWETKFSSLKSTVVVTAISSALAIAAINLGLIQTMFAAFESGKSSATALTQATEQMKQTEGQHRALSERMEQQARSPRR